MYEWNCQLGGSLQGNGNQNKTKQHHRTCQNKHSRTFFCQKLNRGKVLWFISFFAVSLLPCALVCLSNNTSMSLHTLPDYNLSLSQSDFLSDKNWKLIETTLTLHIDAPDLLSHRTGIYLAHITSPITFTQLLNSQSPRSHVFMNDTNAGIVSYDTFF